MYSASAQAFLPEHIQMAQSRNSLLNARSHCTHYNDVIMTTVASQITSLTVVCSIFYSDADQRKHQSATGLCVGKSPETGEFPAQRASNVENASIWWRHHVVGCRLSTPTNSTQHQPSTLWHLDYLFNRLFYLTAKKAYILRIANHHFVRGIRRWPQVTPPPPPQE